MTFGAARDLPSQVVAIPMTSFGMLMNSPDSEFRGLVPKNADVAGRNSGFTLNRQSANRVEEISRVRYEKLKQFLA